MVVCLFITVEHLVLIAPIFSLLVSPVRARYFSLLRQRKVSKRKAIPEACPLRGFPALLVKPGARATRCAQTGASFIRSLLRCSAAPDGGNSKPTPKTSRFFPFALTEYRSQSGTRRAPCLSESSKARCASCVRPRSGEERRGSAQPMSAPECPSLWVLSLGQARESTSPEWAKQEGKRSIPPVRAKQADKKASRPSGRNQGNNKEPVSPNRRKT